MPLTDGEANRSTFLYDGHGRLHRTRYPVAAVGANESSTAQDGYEQYGYDAAGNVTSFRNRANETATFAYDALGRMTGLDRPGSEPDVTFGHDNLGRLTSAAQPGHSLSFTYDALGRQLSEAGPQATVERTFDSGGRQTSLRTLRNGGQNYYVSYQHLVTGELSAIVDGASQTLASFGYDQLGRRTSLAQAHGGTTSYGYDAVSRLTSHSIDNPGTSADNVFTLSYNPAGQVAARTTSHPDVPFNQHANVNRSDSVNGLNQVTQSGSATVTHDARGNMTSDGTRTFGYRSDNAMTSASGGVTLSYDPLGRLYEIAGPSGSRQLVHDGASLIQEYGSGSMAAA